MGERALDRSDAASGTKGSGVRRRPSGVVAADRFSAREIGVFFAATCALSWSMGLLLLVMGGSLVYLVLLLGAAGPLIVAMAMTWRSEGSVRSLWRQIARWRVGWRWYVVALAVPVALFGGSLLALALVNGPGMPSDAPPLWSALLILPAYVLLIGGPEEPGWRGYALPRLQARFSALTATLILGAMWAIWHAPLFVLPVEVYEGLNFGLYAVLTLAVSVIYTWLYNSTGGSVLLAMVLHGVINLCLLWYPSTQGLLPLTVLAAGACVVALGIVLLYGPETLARSGQPRTARQHARMQEAT